MVTEESKKEEKEYFFRSVRYLTWFVGYIIAIYIAGIVVASSLFLGAFLFFEAKMRWWGILISIVSTIALLNLVSNVMNLYWPQSLLGL